MITNQSISPYGDGGVDRKALTKVNERFLQLHALRMQRWRTQATEKQQFLVDVIGLLLDVNHPLLPGYVGKSCPARVFQFRPEPEALRLMRVFSLNYTWQKSHLLSDIQSVFLMGSCGTIAQTTGSDLDFWVCVRDGLTVDETALLRKKLDRLTEFGQTIGVQASFFLMQAQAFRQGHSEHLSHEDCGSTQHQLLLDEFYRSSLWIAGAYPLWWIVPVAEEANYIEFTNNLLQKRHIQADKFLDLGSVLPVPDQEFLGAGLWQLFKGIDSPFKSVLKILLAEVYASESPQVRPLSLDLKEALFLRAVDSDALDPYVLLYERVACYLEQREEFARLELARQCFYLKTQEPLSHALTKNNWRRQLLQRLVVLWGWTQADLHRLDSLGSWSVASVRLLQNRLVQELEHAYQVLQEYAKNVQVQLVPRLKQDLDLLGRRLEAVYREQPGKILRLNAQFCGGRHWDQWVLQEESTGEWVVKESVDDLEPAYRGHYWVDTLLWLLANGLATPTTRWKCLGVSGLDKNTLHDLVSGLYDSKVLQLEWPEDSQLEQSLLWQSMLLVIHHTKPEAGALERRGLLRVADNGNPFAYGETRQNFLERLDVVIRNSWQELLVHSYVTEDSLAYFFLDLLEHAAYKLDVEGVQVNPGQLSGQLGVRLQQIIRSLLQIRESCVGNWMYLLRLGAHFLVLIQHNQQYRIQYLEDLLDLSAVFDLEPDQPFQVFADTTSLYGEALGLFLTGRKPGMVRVGVIRRWFRCQLVFEDGQGVLWVSPVLEESGIDAYWQRVLSEWGQDLRLTWLDMPLATTPPLVRYWPMSGVQAECLQQIIRRQLGLVLSVAESARMPREV